MKLHYLGKAVTFIFYNQTLKETEVMNTGATDVFHFVDEQNALIQIVLDPEDVPSDFFSTDEALKSQALQEILDLSQYNLPQSMQIMADPYPNDNPEFQYITSMLM